MRQIATLTRPPLLCGAVLLAAACTRLVSGTAVPVPGTVPRHAHGVNVDVILLDQSRIRAIAGAGDDLTIIPAMDVKFPVDIDALAETAPWACRFIYADTATFGTDVEEFHKITFQDPPKGDLISEGAAAYRDVDAARRALTALAGAVGECATSAPGQLLVGAWDADTDSLHIRPGGCSRDYRVVSTVLLEVTSCGFPQSVSDLVMTNIAANLPN